jgi:hypothetical protein
MALSMILQGSRQHRPNRNNLCPKAHRPLNETTGKEKLALERNGKRVAFGCHFKFVDDDG